ncbi:MAG: exo-alpha-sialidase [Sedimentisphaerales bacterium]|nr:exo-alpha-sialidase [Sedimentisphaerales bacterium]
MKFGSMWGIKLFAWGFLVLSAIFAHGEIVAWWPLDEGLGQGARDASGNGCDGFLGDSTDNTSKDPSWVYDSVRNRYVLEWTWGDVDEYVNLDARIDYFQGLTEGTIVAWINRAAVELYPVDIILAASDSSDASSDFRFFVNYRPVSYAYDSLFFNVRNDGIKPAVVRTDDQLAVSPFGGWHHVAVTVSAVNEVKLYIDGVEQPLDPAGISTSPLGFFAGVSDIDTMGLGRNVDSDGTEMPFDGRMSDVAVFDQVLSADEIALVATGVATPGALDYMVMTGTPENGAIQVGLATILSWEEPAAASGPMYHVYLGTDTDLSDDFVGATSSTSFVPALLVGQTYYWRVDVVTATDTYTGVMMSFTTQGKATDPNPADGSVDVYTGTSLGWSGDVTSARYDVYSGLSPDALEYLDNVQATVYEPVEKLEGQTEYYWRIDTRNASGELVAEGDVWSFTTDIQGSFLEQTDVFVSGTEGYHTFRIPAIIRTQQGTLLAFCEGRKNSSADSGDIDIVLKRSHDDGQTWGSLELVYEEGDTATITIGNPCVVVDKETGRIWLAFYRNNMRVFVGYSDDDGVTWSEREEITEAVVPAEWYRGGTGPGVGIQLQETPYAGRLVVPCWHQYYDGTYGSHVIYSDDHGATWTHGPDILPDSSECQVVELDNGVLVLNHRRSGSHTGYRGVSTSNDGGATWSPIAPDYELIEPTCQASFLRHTQFAKPDKNRLLFSNPAATNRTNMTIKLSYDEGDTWPVAKTLYAGSSAYSCLMVEGDYSLGCLYERDSYGKITFAHFSLEWLTNGADKVTLLGDLTLDRVVNMEDLALMVNNWLVDDRPCTVFPIGDLSEDCIVNMEDLSWLISMWLEDFPYSD